VILIPSRPYPSRLHPALASIHRQKIADMVGDDRNVEDLSVDELAALGMCS
jgi:hypothetical protein